MRSSSRSPWSNPARRLRLSTALALAGLAALACKRREAEPDDGAVTRVTIDDPAGHWAREGFVELVPPVRLPSTSATLDDVAIWLRLPDDGVIATQVADDSRVLLEFPPGTVIDRVESRGPADDRVVIDVRGTRIAADGAQWLHTYRRAGKGRDRSLFGYEWPRDDTKAHERATARLLDELGERPPGAAMSTKKRERYLASIERKNQCTSCHGYARPTNTREGEHGLVNRGTDASGFFTPLTVLTKTVVLERYGKLDPNLDDPAIEIACPDDAQPSMVERHDRLRAECPARAVPLATVDLREVEGERLAGLCRARRYLHDHLDAEGKQLFGPAIAACDMVTTGAEGT